MKPINLKKAALSGTFCLALLLLIAAGGIDTVNALCLALIGGALACLFVTFLLCRRWGAELSHTLDED